MYDKDVKEIVGQLTEKEKNKFIEDSLILVRRNPNDKTLGKHQREHIRSIIPSNPNE